MNRLHANYSVVIVSVLNHAWTVFGKFTPENHDQVVLFVRKSMREILDGQPAPKVDPSNILRGMK